MSYAPASLATLGNYWTAKGGVNLGVVGNTRHCVGYHLGRDRIFSNCACRPDGDCVAGLKYNDYSVIKTRDQAGLNDAASAIDLGKLNGTLTGLQTFSRWLVARCQANVAGSNDIREIIYSPDGTAVRRWDQVTRTIYVAGDGTNQGDNSHRLHTHISFYRDSQARDKRPLFEPYFAGVMAGPLEPGDDMPLTDDDVERIAAAVWAVQFKDYVAQPDGTRPPITTASALYSARADAHKAATAEPAPATADSETQDQLDAANARALATAQRLRNEATLLGG